MNTSVLYFTTFSVVKKFMHRSGVEYQDFPSKTFCLTVSRNFVRTPFIVSLLSGAEKVWIREGGEYQDFLSKIFCLTVLKNFVGEHFCAVFQKTFGCEKMDERGGSIKIFRRKLLVSQC